MTHPSPALRLPALFVTLLVATLAVITLLPAGANAAAPVDGKATFTLGTGKSGKQLKKQRVTLAGVAQTRVRRLSGKRFRAVLLPGSLKVSPDRAHLKGAVRLRKGKRSLVVRNFTVAAVKKNTVVTAKVGGKKIRLFTAAGKLRSERMWQNLKWHMTATLKNSRLKLTPAAARTIRRKLKLKHLSAGRVGTLKLNISRLDEPVVPPPVDLGDPYFAQCGIMATEIGAGTFPPAAALPNPIGAKQVQADSPNFDWGLKEGLRSYLKMFKGSMHALDGASLIGEDGTGSLKPVLFSFPVAGGEYSSDTGTGFVKMSGTGVFCNPEHGFRVAFSNPTVVIDGENSRIDADVDFNKFGTWVKAQRTAVATLDPTGITPTTTGNATESEITWTDIPASFTDAGALPFCAEGGPPGTPSVCIYGGPGSPKGATPIDPVTITMKVREDG